MDFRRSVRAGAGLLSALPLFVEQTARGQEATVASFRHSGRSES